MVPQKAIIYTLICLALLVGCGDKATNSEDRSWKAMTSGTTSYLQGVWGSSESDIFAVGSGGVILHYDGSSWSQMNSGTSEWLSAISGRSGTDVYVTGGNGEAFHYNGTDWSSMNTGSPGILHDVWTSAGQAVYMVGGSGVLQYSEGVWQELSGSPDGSSLCGLVGRIHPTFPQSVLQLFVAGGGRLQYYVGNRWTPQEWNLTTMRGIWTTSGSPVFAVGKSGTIWRSDGRRLVVAAKPLTQTLNSIDGNSGSHIFAVGSIGGIAHFNGKAWAAMPTPTTVNLTDVWVSPNGEAFAVGYQGTILHYGP